MKLFFVITPIRRFGNTKIIFPYSDRIRKYKVHAFVSKFKWIKIVPLRWIVRYQSLDKNHFTLMLVNSRSMTGNYLQLLGTVSWDVL